MNDFAAFWAAFRLNVRKFFVVVFLFLLAKWFCQFMQAPVPLDLRFEQPDLNGSVAQMYQFLSQFKCWLLTMVVMLTAKSLVEKPR